MALLEQGVNALFVSLLRLILVKVGVFPVATCLVPMFYAGKPNWHKGNKSRNKGRGGLSLERITAAGAE